MNLQEAEASFPAAPTAWWRSPAQGSTGPAGWSPLGSSDWTWPRSSDRPNHGLSERTAVVSAEPPFCAAVPPRYQTLCELGRGGMGVVYKARDTKLDRLVALKVLPSEWSDDEIARRRLICEAQAASAIDHPNICTIYDIDSTDAGQLCIVMAYCDGQTLRERLQGGALETEEILDIATQISDALEAAHTHGIVHRDIKPGNILIGSSGMVKIVDFGLASRLSGALGARALDERDIPGSPLGTPNYMAPERILELPVDPRTDLFSLGVVMYEMATQRKPFAGASVSETVANVLDRDPLPVTSLSPGRPRRLERVISKALAKEPGTRFQSASALREALRLIRRTPWPKMRTIVQPASTTPGLARRRSIPDRSLPPGLNRAAGTRSPILFLRTTIAIAPLKL